MSEEVPNIDLWPVHAYVFVPLHTYVHIHEHTYYTHIQIRIKRGQSVQNGLLIIANKNF